MCIITDFRAGDIVEFAPTAGCRARGVLWGRVIAVGRQFLTIHQYGAGVAARMEPDEIGNIVATVPSALDRIKNGPPCLAVNER